MRCISGAVGCHRVYWLKNGTLHGYYKSTDTEGKIVKEGLYDEGEYKRGRYDAALTYNPKYEIFAQPFLEHLFLI